MCDTIPLPATTICQWQKSHWYTVRPPAHLFRAYKNTQKVKMHLKTLYHFAQELTARAVLAIVDDSACLQSVRPSVTSCNCIKIKRRSAARIMKSLPMNSPTFDCGQFCTTYVHTFIQRNDQWSYLCRLLQHLNQCNWHEIGNVLFEKDYSFNFIG